MMKNKTKKYTFHLQRLFIAALMCLPIWCGDAWAQEAYVAFDRNSKTLTFRYDDDYDLYSPIYYLNDGDKVEPKWLEYYKDEICKVVFDRTFAKVRPTSCYMWFCGCENLKTIEGLKYLNTSYSKDMSYMFSGCYCLRQLDLSGLNTSNVEDMSYMFSGCTFLEELNLSGLNTANVRNMSYMFSGCDKLQQLDLSEFNTENVRNMSEMFCSCYNLSWLNISGFNTSKVEDMSNMFKNCDNLLSLNLFGFNTANVTNMSGMFFACRNLNTIYASDKFVTSKVQESSEMFNYCFSLTGVMKYDNERTDATYANLIDGYFTNYAAFAYFDKANNTLTFMYGQMKPEAFPLYDGNEKQLWLYYNNEIQTVVFDPSFAQVRPTSCSGWFYLCENLTTIKGLENLNTEEVTDMSKMFIGCKSIHKIDLSNFNTEKVTDMSYMFSGCNSLSAYDFPNFNTEKVTNMSHMFQNCNSLSALDLSAFNTANVTDMSYMFAGCEKLSVRLVLNSFNTENVTNMCFMFSDCKFLTSLDLSNFNTSKVTDMHYMFNGCIRLTSLDLSSFNTGKVTTMEGMFRRCKFFSLDLSNFNTKRVKSMHEMFAHCKSLSELDLSWFNTRNVTNMFGMFYDCEWLRTIYVSDNFVTTKVDRDFPIFSGCSHLKGAIQYDENKTGVEYANYTDGYFTCRPKSVSVYYDKRDQTLTFMYDIAKPGSFPLNNGEEFPEWFDLRAKIKTVVFDPSFAQVRPTSCYNWFSLCDNLTTIEDFENLNTEDVTNMNGMFYWCRSLTSLDLSGFNTSKVKDMSSMFFGCGKLTSLDLSGLNTSNVENMSAMFYWCSSLSSLDLSSFNTANVTDMNGMFFQCKKLTSLNLSNFNTANVTYMYWMFYLCDKLTSLDLSGFNTVNVTSMNSMFSFCPSLTSLDLSNFNTANVDDMRDMFSYCPSLTTIYVSDKFVTTNVQESDAMFTDCTSLEGAIKYDENKTDATYANYIDGYFINKNFTGIYNTFGSESDVNKISYYDLQGRKHPRMQHGINVIRRGNKTCKVLCK